jgi:uncharacterized protein YndB with AHSA1/START domain
MYSIKEQIRINAPVSAVWKQWTTVEGVKNFFAPEAKLSLTVYGEYELYFILDNPPGLRGGEGNKIIAWEENKMLSVTWNAPPQFGELRNFKTHVAIYFSAISESETDVTLIHDGFGIDEGWESVYEYFSFAWKKVVLRRLKCSMEIAPVNWSSPVTVKELEMLYEQ